MPVRRPSSSTSSAATSRPSSRANRDEVGEVQLAGRGRRLQVADPAPEPGGVEGVQAGVDLGDLALLVGRVLVLDDPLHRPALVAHDPAEARRVDARPRRPAPSRRGPARGPRAARERRSAFTSGTSPDRTRTSSTSSGSAASAARTASPVPRGSSWRAASARPATASRTSLGRRRVDDDRARAGRRRRRHRARTRASAGRTARGGPSGRATSSACRDRPRARRRRSAAWRGRT